MCFSLYTIIFFQMNHNILKLPQLISCLSNIAHVFLVNLISCVGLLWLAWVSHAESGTYGNLRDVTITKLS